MYPNSSRNASRISQYLSRAKAPYIRSRCSLRSSCTRSLSMSTLSTSNRKTTVGVLIIALSSVSERSVPASALLGDASARADLAQQFFRDLHHALRLEAEFPLEFLERG